MGTRLLEQHIAEEEIREKIRESLPDEKKSELNSLICHFEEMNWALNAPVLHSLFISPLATAVIIWLECHFNGIRLGENFLFLLVSALFLLFLTFKLSRRLLEPIYRKSVSRIERDILQDFKKNSDLWDLLWLVRSRSCERDKETATRIMQMLLRETL